MYERMLDKQSQPTVEEMTAYCGSGGEAFSALNAWLTDACGTAQAIAFPYGKQYGWGVAHRLHKKLICNVFPENGAFSVMLRLDNCQFDRVCGKVSADARQLIDHKYPCADGGWLHFRVLTQAHADDVRMLLAEKCTHAK